MSTAISAEVETEFDQLLSILSTLPPGRMAIWNDTDPRKSKSPFFPNHRVADMDKIVFVIRNRAMIAVFRNATMNKFYLRFYWLASECPGYISPSLSYQEVSGIVRDFLNGMLNMNKTKATVLQFQPILDQCETYKENNNIHTEVLQKIFQVDNLIAHLDKTL